MEQSRRVVVVALITISVVVSIAAVTLARGGNTPASAAVAARSDSGPRVIVEVLNGTTKPRLARAATSVLRRAGLDVVYFGNGAAPAEDSTDVLVRRGAVEAGERVAKALGLGRVRRALDTLRRVDVTVILGGDFVPPAGLLP